MSSFLKYPINLPLGYPCDFIPKRYYAEKSSYSMNE